MSDGTTPVIVFTDGTTPVNILWTASSNINPPDICYDFTPTDNDWVPSHYSNTGNSYAYTPPTAPAPGPNPIGFTNAIEADSTLTSLLSTLAPFYAAIGNYESSPQTIKTIWSQISPSLPSSAVTTIEGYAANNNMPLT